MSRTGIRNPHRSGLQREPRRWEKRGYTDRRTASGGEPILMQPSTCWCGESHALHWGPLPDLPPDEPVKAQPESRVPESREAS